MNLLKYKQLNYVILSIQLLLFYIFLKELVEQSKKIQFDITMKIFSILRYIIDNLTKYEMNINLLEKETKILL